MLAAGRQYKILHKIGNYRSSNREWRKISL